MTWLFPVRLVIFFGSAGRGGSFSRERHIPDRGGIDTIVLTATRGARTCAGTVLF